MIETHAHRGGRPRHGEFAVEAIVGYEGRHVVVTGGAGFIGSSLCRVLAASGARVSVVDDLTTGTLDNLPDATSPGAETPRHGSIEVTVADVRDTDTMHRVVRDADVVFHLACLGVRHSLSHPAENLAVNADGALSVLEAARHGRVRRIVHVSSSEVYGDARCAPMTEDHPTWPHTVYGAGKLAGEACARAVHRTHGTDVVVIRPFNAYGPRSHAEGDSGEVIPRFIVQALAGDPLVVHGSGAQTRDFTHVHDTSATIAKAGLVRGVAGETFNVGSGREVSVARLAELIVDLTGSRSPVVHDEPRPGDVARLIADSTRAEQRLGHRPTVPLVEGLADLVARTRSVEADAFAAVAEGIAARNWNEGVLA